jgi:hypothetical protein
MLTFDIERARLAVQFLVDGSYFSHHVKKLRTLIKKPRALPFKEEAEVLNELVLIGRQDPQKLEQLIKVAEFKRSSHNEKQADLMRARRTRERMAIELEEILSGKKIVTAEARRQFLLRQYEVWNKQKNTHVAQLGDAFIERNNELPNWDHQNQFKKDFWDKVDIELSAMLEEAKRTLGKTVTRKRVVVIEKPTPEPSNPAVKVALKKALEARIKKEVI